VLAAWVALAGMVSALGLFNALLLGFSRLPYVMGTDGLLPRTLAATDARGTPRNAVLAAAVVYSAFVLIPFHGLVVADVVLYCLALFMEFAALVALRVREPTLRGAFRIPLGPVGVGALALLPTTVLLAVVVLSFLDGEYGTPAIVGAGVAIVAGPIAYRIAERYRARRAAYGRR
jgi:amino acid transporter